MRVTFSLVLLALLGGCQQSFDDRYKDTEQQLKADAEKLDKDMATAAAKEPGTDAYTDE
jgi:hypothetical protein